MKDVKNNNIGIDWERTDKLIEMALKEDFGEQGDLTTLALVPDSLVTEAKIVCKTDCVCAGLPVAERVFMKLAPSISWTNYVSDGDFCKKGTILAILKGKASAILSGERTALNFVQRLSGIATMAYQYASIVKNTNTKILDTRKTTPGWRNLEKYAVATGGCTNHRIGLYDRIMIKDNHRELAGTMSSASIKYAVSTARKKYPDIEIEVEADTLEEVKQAVEAEADYILLDNMSTADMKEAVKINNGKCKLEASGGITLDRIKEIAVIGVDYISVGALTHSAPAADISMEIQFREESEKSARVPENRQ